MAIRSVAVTLVAVVVALASCSAGTPDVAAPPETTLDDSTTTDAGEVASAELGISAECVTGSPLYMTNSGIQFPTFANATITVAVIGDVATFTFDGIDLDAHLVDSAASTTALVRMTATGDVWLVASYTGIRDGFLTPSRGAEIGRYGYGFDDVGELVTDDVTIDINSDRLVLSTDAGVLDELGGSFAFEAELRLLVPDDTEESVTITECIPTSFGDYDEDGPQAAVDELPTGSAGVTLVAADTDPDPDHWMPSRYEAPFQAQIRLFDQTPQRIPSFPYTQNGCGTRQIHVKWRTLGGEAVSGYSFWSDTPESEAPPATEGTLIVGGCHDAMFRSQAGTIVDIVVEVSVMDPAVG